jgi:hypothetical protein
VKFFAFQDFAEIEDLKCTTDQDKEKLGKCIDFLKKDEFYAIFIKEWENATKMRKWYADEKQRLSGLEEEEYNEKLKEMRDLIVEKAKVLVKLQPPSYYMTSDPSQGVASLLGKRQGLVLDSKLSV